jgi:hypothetical protein
MMLWISGCEPLSSSRDSSVFLAFFDSGSLSPGTSGSSFSELGAEVGSFADGIVSARGFVEFT